MAVKDYYRILNISSSATTEEIRKAFRKLAQQYHPDKNNNDPNAAAKFSDIQEAYRVLSAPKTRAEYNYARYTQNPKRSVIHPAYTPEDILVVSTKLAKEIAFADPYRVDHDLLYYQLMDILSGEHVHLLRLANNEVINRKILEQVTASSHLLPFNKLIDVIKRLERLTENDPVAEIRLQQFISQAKQQYYWNRYKVYIALAVALLACYFILLSRK